jgi:hypothetical protein
MSDQEFPSVESVMHYVITSMAELGPAGTELSLDEIYNKTIRALLEHRKLTIEQRDERGAQNRSKIKRIIWSALDRLRKVDRVRNLPGKNNNASAIWVLKSSNKLSLSEDEARRISEEAEKLGDDHEESRPHDLAPVWPSHAYDGETTNVILYGPPGTGKTFRTTGRAVELARGAASAEGRAEYRRLMEAGQIVFVTFHQSYGYEEFVEGIRPEATEDGQVSYEVRWGALRKIADAAQRALVVAQRQERLWDAAVRLAPTVGKPLRLEVSEQALTLHYESSHASRAPASSGAAQVDEAEGELGRLGELVRGEDETVRKELIKFLQRAHAERSAQPTGQIDWAATRQYVMIIDEINRGNMSRIFGELITLLEPTKRLGAPDELVVTLPASGDRFGLPPNLHFVGTMNTADRSIALLDVALRRRFQFEELMPDPSCVKASANGAKLMAALNKRISILLDREHQLGHALFMRASDDAGLVRVLRRDVLPLLKEYFYGDWERIAAVLGCSKARAGEDDALVYCDKIEGHGLPSGLFESGEDQEWRERGEVSQGQAEAIIARVIKGEGGKA